MSPAPRRRGLLARRALAVGLIAGAVLLTDRLLKAYYYSFTYRYYEAGEVYQEDSNTLLLFSPDRYLFWAIKPDIRMTIAEDPEQYALHTLGPARGHYEFTVRSNSAGLNSPEIPTRKPPQTVRIVTLGDSRTMAEGIPFDRLYSRILERTLDDDGDTRYQVINAGVSGYSSYQGLEQLKRSMLDYAPDYVTVLFGINDQDTLQGISDRDKEAIFDSPLTTFRAWCNRSMTLYFLGRQVVKVKAALFGKTAIGPTVYRSSGGVRRVSFEEYADNLREIVRLGEERGFTPILVIVPTSPYAFYPELFPPDPEEVDLERELSVAAGDYEVAARILLEILEAHPEFPKARYLLAQCYQALGRYEGAQREFLRLSRDIVFSRYEEVVRRVAGETGAILLDLTPEFTAITAAQLYIDDMHPAERGHEIIARRIAEVVEAQRARPE